MVIYFLPRAFKRPLPNIHLNLFFHNIITVHNTDIHYIVTNNDTNKIITEININNITITKHTMTTRLTNILCSTHGSITPWCQNTIATLIHA